MKMIYFKSTDEKVMDGIMEKAFEMISNGKYAESYERRDIVPCRIKDKNGMFGFIISVDDCVPVAFNITARTSMEGAESVYELVVESGLFSGPLKLPKTVELSLNWKEDSVNRYKIIKLNRDKIKDMVEQGIDDSVIAETFGITWTGEDSEWIIDK